MTVISSTCANPWMNILSLAVIGNEETQAIDIVDDYREAYWHLRDHTPKDARVMAWWDYGYQITGVGERTTVADGNT